MKKSIVIHGLAECPYAWRTRLAADEKNVPFEWIAADVKNPDSRAKTQNPDRHSPMMIHDWLTLSESMIICQYIDEAIPGRPLQNEDPAKRALERVAMHELDFEFINGDLQQTEMKTRIRSALESLELRLREGPWLGGEAPSLLDVKIIPFLAKTVVHLEGTIPSERPQCRKYFDWWRERDSYRRTKPLWAP